MKKYLFFCVAFLFVISSCAFESFEPGKKPDVDAITIHNKISEIIAGRQHQFEATFSPLEANEPESYTWKSSNTSVATINSAGLFTAIDEGVVSITLTSEAPRKKGYIELSDEITITVLPIEIEEIELDNDYLEILNGTTETLTPSIMPTNAKPKEIEWLSNDHSVATVADGVVTAHSAGYAIITVKVKDTDIQASCQVRVTPIVLSSIRFETTVIQLEERYTQETVLIFVPDNAENKDVAYTSSDLSIASFLQTSEGVVIKAESNGVEDTDKETGPGFATITATSIEGGHNAVCSVYVYSVPDLVTVSIEKEAFAGGSVASGKITATLTNNSSKSVFVKDFRVMERPNQYISNIHKAIQIGETLDPSDSYIEESVTFVNVSGPQAEFTIIYEGKEYKRNVKIE